MVFSCSSHETTEKTLDAISETSSHENDIEVFADYLCKYQDAKAEHNLQEIRSLEARLTLIEERAEAKYNMEELDELSLLALRRVVNKCQNEEMLKALNQMEEMYKQKGKITPAN